MDELKIADLQKLCGENKIKWTLHALRRLRERKIKSGEIVSCIMSGAIIEQYPDDKPLPSCLINGKSGNKAIHAVVSSDINEMYIITAYEPNPDEWENDFSQRKESK